MRTTRLGFAALSLFAVAGCANDGPTASEASAGVVEATIVAQDIRFDDTLLEVDVGVELVLTFDNRDANIPHNLHVRGAGIDTATPILPGTGGTDAHRHFHRTRGVRVRLRRPPGDARPDRRRRLNE